MPDTPDVSIVIPVYRNALTLRELHRRVAAAMTVTGQRFEIIFVNDASPDDSADVLASLAAEAPVIVLTLARNVGQHRAVLAGLARARGRAAVVLDADLQDPPEAIPLLLARLQEGFGAVYAGRRGVFQPLFRRITSRVFKASMRAIAGVPVDMGPFAAMDRRMVDRVLARAPERPFLPALVMGAGLPIASVPVERAPRPVGRSAYSGWDRLVMGAGVMSQILRPRRHGGRGDVRPAAGDGRDRSDS